MNEHLSTRRRKIVGGLGAHDFTLCPSAADVIRYRELAAPGRVLNVFESVELEELEDRFGAFRLPLPVS